MTQDIADTVEKGVGNGVVIGKMAVKRVKSTSQCSLGLNSLLTALYRRKRDKSEERKARKAEKKRLKDEEEMRQVAELSIYSATDNPFHDVNLGQQFRWHKKNEKEKKMGLSPAEVQRKDAMRRQEAKEELERLNRRRAEREAEQRLREEEEVRMQRLAESAQMAEWIAKDGDFQLDQERRRAAIRVKEKRAKAIDFLALNLRYVNPIDDGDDDPEEAGLEIDLDEPYNILDVRLSFFFRTHYLSKLRRISLQIR
jgi:Conserved mid region of cactin